MYLTYEEYKIVGGELDRGIFMTHERVARRKIDYYTYNRVKNIKEVPTEVKECMLSLIEYMSSLDSVDGKEIEREKTDTYEIQYSIPRKDLKEYNIKNIIKEYLTHTGLLYRGI